MCQIINWWYFENFHTIFVFAIHTNYLCIHSSVRNWYKSKYWKKLSLEYSGKNVNFPFYIDPNTECRVKKMWWMYVCTHFICGFNQSISTPKSNEKKSGAQNCSQPHSPNLLYAIFYARCQRSIQCIELSLNVCHIFSHSICVHTRLF